MREPLTTNSVVGETQDEEIPFLDNQNAPVPFDIEYNDAPKKNPKLPTTKSYLVILWMIYDMLAILICIADMCIKYYLLFSDSIVDIYYNAFGHIIFAVSLLVFFPNQQNGGKCHYLYRFIKFIIFITISPLMPFVTYLFRSNYNDAKLSYVLTLINSYIKPPECDVELDKKENKYNISAYQWLQISRYQHRGFLVQTYVSLILSLIHVIQIANAVGKDSIYISSGMVGIYISSVVLTVISIIFRAVIYHIRETVFQQSYLYNCLSSIYDYVGILLIYFAVFGIHLGSQFENSYEIIFIILCSVLSICLVFRLNHCMLMISKLLQEDNPKGVCFFVCMCAVMFFWDILLGSFGCALICLGNVNKSMDLLFQFRFQNSKRQKFTPYDSDFWTKMQTFINDSDDKKDTLQKLCCINMELFSFKNYDKKNDKNQWDHIHHVDPEFESFLQTTEQTLFTDIDKYEILSRHTSYKYISTNCLFHLLFPHLNELWLWSRNKFMVYWQQKKHVHLIALSIYFVIQVLLILLASLYYILKLIHFIAPIILIICVLYFNLHHNTYLIIILAIYSVLTIAISVYFPHEIQISNLFSNILPFQKIPSITNKQDVIFHEKRICFYYRELKEIPQREQILIDIFGCDISSIINDYISRFSYPDDLDVNVELAI
eukprot:2175_1